MMWLASEADGPGRPLVFSGAAIQFCLMVEVLYGLPRRQAAGMVASILAIAGLDWPVPDFSTLSRREKTVAVQMLPRGPAGPLNLRIDKKAQAPSLRAPRRTGSRFQAMENGWAASTARKRDPHRSRPYHKAYLAMDTATGRVRAVQFTSAAKVTAHSSGNSPRTVFFSSSLPDLPDQVLPDEHPRNRSAP